MTNNISVVGHRPSFPNNINSCSVSISPALWCVSEGLWVGRRCIYVTTLPKHCGCGDKVGYEKTHLIDQWGSWVLENTLGGGCLCFGGQSRYQAAKTSKRLCLFLFINQKSCPFKPWGIFLLNGTVCSILHLSCFSYPISTFSHSLRAYINKKKAFVWGMFWKGWWYVCVCIYSWPSGILLSGNLVFIKKVTIPALGSQNKHRAEDFYSVGMC